MKRASSRSGRPNTPLCIERLESRNALAVTWDVTFDDPGQAHSGYYAEIRATLLAAGADWSRYFPTSNAAIQLSVKFADLSGNILAQASSATSVLYQKQGNLEIREMSVPHEIRTGADANGAQADAVITLDADKLSSDMWFDPTPTNRDDEMVPSYQEDAYSIFLHEMGHCLGFDGWRDWTTGALPANYESRFDQLVSMAPDGTPYFNGPAAKAAYFNQPVPLTYSNLFHLGNDTYGTGKGAGRPGADLANDLMNGLYSQFGQRYRISWMDLAVLQDIGLPASQVPIDTPPLLSDVADQTIDEDGTLSVPLVLGDLESVGSLVTTVTSNYPALLPDGSAKVFGSGANRTLVMNPAANANGSALVTITVSDGKLSVSDTFQLTVTPVYDPPTISGTFFAAMDEDGSATLTFTIGSVETDVSKLSVTASSGNTTLFPPGSLRLSGSGSTRTLTIVPAANQNTGFGSAYVNITVRDAVVTWPSLIEVVVRPVDDPPAIDFIPDQFLAVGESRELRFKVQDAETPMNQLNYWANWTNEALIPRESLTVYYLENEMEMILTPTPGMEGISTITVFFGDSQGAGSRTFNVRVAADPFPWSNLSLRFDVDGDSRVVAHDAMSIISRLNMLGPGPLAWREAAAAAAPFYDVHPDNLLTAADALDVIDFLNTNGPLVGHAPVSSAEGEAADADSGLATSRFDALFASDPALWKGRTRR